MATMGRVYMELGEYEQSTEMLEQSHALLRKEFGEKDPKVLKSAASLATSLIRQADNDRAGDLLERTLPLNEAVFGKQSIEVGANLFWLAELHINTSDYANAERYARRSAAVYELFETEEPTEFAESKNLLGRALQMGGDLEGGEVLIRESLDILERNDENDHPFVPLLPAKSRCIVAFERRPGGGGTRTGQSNKRYSPHFWGAARSSGDYSG